MYKIMLINSNPEPSHLVGHMTHLVGYMTLRARQPVGTSSERDPTAHKAVTCGCHQRLANVNAKTATLHTTTQHKVQHRLLHTKIFTEAHPRPLLNSLAQILLVQSHAVSCQMTNIGHRDILQKPHQLLVLATQQARVHAPQLCCPFVDTIRETCFKLPAIDFETQLAH